MASGLGVRGTTGRCYMFLSDLNQCLAEERASAFEVKDPKLDKPLGCRRFRDDYFECLHSRKEFARTRAVLEEKAKQEYEAKHGVTHSHAGH